MRNYDKDFKINAVSLYKSSGRSLKTIAEELGLSTSTLSTGFKSIRKRVVKAFLGKDS